MSANEVDIGFCKMHMNFCHSSTCKCDMCILENFKKNPNKKPKPSTSSTPIPPSLVSKTKYKRVSSIFKC